MSALPKPQQHSLVIREARPADAGRGLARIDIIDMRSHGLASGDLVALAGHRTSYARVMPAPPEARGQGLILIDGIMRHNLGAAIGDTITIAAAEARTVEKLTVQTQEQAPGLAQAMRHALQDMPVAAGDRLSLRLFGGRPVLADAIAVTPAGAVLVTATTQVEILGQPSRPEKRERSLTYEDLGGMGSAVQRVREVVELPIRRGDLFERLGIDPPRGVLLSGPPGTGKTLLARAVAAESAASFFQINGPEIIGKHYGESEEQLRAIFAAAAKKAPAIIFIDEIDAIAPKREMLTGDKQVERRMVAQLLTLMDGLSDRGQIIVLAATNLADSLDPALRRPGRFDREIAIAPPDRIGRKEILDIHARGMPLSAEIDLEIWASRTHGYVGADLAALTREAGIAALRRLSAFEGAEPLDPSRIEVINADFETAFAELRPSALREVFSEVPETRWADVAGADEVRQTLTEAVIWPLHHADAFRTMRLKPARGVLLAGPPGTGKTLVARALANEAGINFIQVRGPELLNQYVGESERAVRALFAKARALSPTILFFDEIDALAPRRGSEHGAVSERIVAQLLTEIDGVSSLGAVFILGATNRVDLIDQALLRPGRFDQVIELPLPDGAKRAAILAVHLKGMIADDTIDCAGLARETDQYSGADLANLVRLAGLAALRRSIADGSEPRLSMPDFTQALIATNASRALRLP
jgi:transitional endoplasmic reticulum ATPase